MLAVITVNSSADNLSNDGLITLREAIQAANTNTSVDGSVAGEVGADTIRFDPSVFTGGTESLIRLGGSELEITESLTIDGSTGVDVLITADSAGNDVTAGAHLTDVSASLSNNASSLDDNSRVLNFSSISGDLNVIGLTMTGGRTTADNMNLGEGQGRETTHSGGGIRFVSTGGLTVTDGTLSGNSTGGEGAAGGGIFTVHGSVMLNNSTLSKNSTAGTFAPGGGIRTGTGAVTLQNSSVTGNATSGLFAIGGGIDTSSGMVSLDQSEISGNSTAGPYAYGGGINAYSGDVTLTNSVLSENSTAGNYAWGGGLTARKGLVTITNSTIEGNSTAGFDSVAGGIHTVDGDILVVRSTISGNFTLGDEAEGGGIRTSYGNVTLTESTVSGNSTAGTNAWGGGIRTWYGDLSISGSTVTNNSTSGSGAHGGGIFVRDSLLDPSLTISNSIIAGNSVAAGSTGPDFQPDPETTITLSYSLIGDNSDTGLTASPTADTEGNLIGSSTQPIDPLLAPLANQGGPTQTHALLPESPAIDAGDPTLGVPDSYQAAVLEDNPTIYLRFEETSGSLGTDSSGNGHTAEYFGVPDLSQPGIGGDSVTALGLDGIDDYANVQDVPISVSFTAESWAFSDTSTWNKFGWTAASQEANGFIIHPNQGERTWQGYVYDDAGTFYHFGNHTPDDITGWHHYAISYDGTIARMFFDGELVVETELLVTRSASATVAIDLGYDDCCPDNRFGAGGLDEFALYDTALDTERIAHHYAVAAAAMEATNIYDQRGFPFQRAIGGRADIGAFELGASSADFDEDGSIDGGDFLAWQRGFGIPEATHSDGDADYDNSVNSLDLAAWLADYGQMGLTPPAAFSPSATLQEPDSAALIAATMEFTSDQHTAGPAPEAVTNDYVLEALNFEKTPLASPRLQQFDAVFDEFGLLAKDDHHEITWLINELLPSELN